MIAIKTPQEIALMRQGGQLLAGIIEKLKLEVRSGVTTQELDNLAESLILSCGGKCSFKGYNVPDDASPNRVYPSCLCTSINEEIVHAIPSGRILKEGDIISLDIGMEYQGFHTDMAITLPVGKINPQIEKLLQTTKIALDLAIEKIQPGNRLVQVSRAVQEHAQSQGFGVVRQLCGHGIGRNIHEDPEILNFVSSGGFDDMIIKEGMVLCVEPMLTVGDWHIKQSPDGFGFSTCDDSLSCHFEHTIAVTKIGHQVLTEK